MVYCNKLIMWLPTEYLVPEENTRDESIVKFDIIIYWQKLTYENRWLKFTLFVHLIGKQVWGCNISVICCIAQFYTSNINKSPKSLSLFSLSPVQTNLISYHLVEVINVTCKMHSTACVQWQQYTSIFPSAFYPLND